MWRRAALSGQVAAFPPEAQAGTAYGTGRMGTCLAVQSAACTEKGHTAEPARYCLAEAVWEFGSRLAALEGGELSVISHATRWGHAVTARAKQATVTTVQWCMQGVTPHDYVHLRCKCQVSLAVQQRDSALLHVPMITWQASAPLGMNTDMHRGA